MTFSLTSLSFSPDITASSSSEVSERLASRSSAVSASYGSTHDTGVTFTSVLAADRTGVGVTAAGAVLGGENFGV